MPIYEYLCNNCEFRESFLEKFDNKDLHECVKCGKNMVRQISTPNFKFKGSGFYETDYKHKK